MSRKRTDLAGNQYGMLTVLGFSHKRNDQSVWHVQCECGVKKTVHGGNLTRGRTKSCGCNSHTWRKESMHLVKDLTEQVFGRLTVLSFAGKDKQKARWNCRCECGSEIVVTGSHMTSNNLKSCGCLQIQSVTKHGLSGHPLMSTWRNMMNRCHDDSHEDYSKYGGVGIRVCDKWRNDPRAFFNDMGDRPAGMTVDRIDGTKDYSKGNCRWATSLEQSNNRKYNDWFSYSGKAYTRKQLCKLLRLSYSYTGKKLKRGKAPHDAFGCSVESISYAESMKLTNGATQWPIN